MPPWEPPDWLGNAIALLIGAIGSQLASFFLLRSDRRKRDAEAAVGRANAATQWEQLAARAAQTMEQFLVEKDELKREIERLERELEVERERGKHRQQALETQATKIANQQKMITQLAGECSELRAKSIEQEAQIKQLEIERDKLLAKEA